MPEGPSRKKNTSKQKAQIKRCKSELKSKETDYRNEQEVQKEKIQQN